MNSAVIYLEPQRRPYQMETLDSGGTWIKNKHVTFRITHHLQDMGMTTYEDVQMILIDQGPCLGIISSGVAPDMGHKYLHTAAVEDPMQWMCIAETMIIAVAGNTDKRLERSDFLCQIKTSTKISCMPDLVYGC